MLRRSERAFTLIELLVVISIIALLIALLLPVVGHASAAGRNAVCMNQQRQMSLATLTYLQDFGAFPAQYIQGSREVEDQGRSGGFYQRIDQWGNVSQVVGRWPRLLLPYLNNSTEVFTCSEEFISARVNTYIANIVFWGNTFLGTCVTAAPYLPGPAGIDDVAEPSRVVLIHETIRDWQGDFYWMVDRDVNWWGDYRGNFQYDNTIDDRGWKFSGGRHFRTDSRIGGRDPWGKDNISMVDGSVRTQVSMQYLVENEPPGLFHSYPFREENRYNDHTLGYLNCSYELVSKYPADVGAEFWTIPWW